MWLGESDEKDRVKFNKTDGGVFYLENDIFNQTAA
jgi:hypothetical protein